MVKLLSKKRIVAMLLALTLICTMFSSLSLVTPMAKAADDGTYVIHVDGKVDATSGAATFVKVPADKVTANKKYTVKATIYGKPLNGLDSELLVRAGEANNSTILARTGSGDNLGTVTAPYANTVAWTVDVTPETATDLYVGIRLNKSNTQTADFYIGNIELIDENGNNVAPEITEDTVVYNAPSATHTISKWDATTLAGYITTQEIVDIDTLDDAIKQVFAPAEEEEDKTYVIHVDGKDDATSGAATFVKIPAANITANKKYTVNITIYGKPLHGADSELLVRAGEANNSTILARTGSGDNLGTVTAPFANTVCWTVDVTPETATDLYVGIRLNKSNTQTADFYIGNIELIDENGNNVAPEITEDTVVYNAPSATHTISKWDATTLAGYITTQEIVDIDTLDDAIKQVFAPAEEEEDKTYVIHVDGKDDATSGAATFVKIPAANITANKKYTVKATIYGKPLHGADSELLVRAGEANNSTILARTGSGDNLGTVTAPFANTVCWTVDVTPETATDLYVGIRLNKSNTQTADFYIGNIELIDENGNNVAPEITEDTVVYNAASATNTISKWDATTLAGYITTQEIVDIDTLDDAIKQVFAPAEEEEDLEGYMLFMTNGTANEAYAIYKKIPADKLTAGKKYALSIKYSGASLNNYDFILMRDNIANGSSNIMTSVDAGENVNCGEYYKFDYEYTAPATPTDLYIGIYLRGTAWKDAEVLIGEMNFVDEDGNNLFTPLGDMSDLYGGYNGKTINSYDASTNVVVRVERRELDSEKFADVLPPDSSEAANKMAHIKGVGGGNVAWVYKKVENVPAGKYVASFLENGTPLTDKILFHVKTDSVNLIETYQGGYKEGDVYGGYYNIELTETSNVYVGFKIAMSAVTSVDMYLASLGLQPLKADGSLGEKLVTPVGITTDWINNRSNGTKDKIFFDADGYANPHNSNPAVYTIDIVDKDKSLFPESDYMLHVKDNADNDDSVVTEIPANKLEAGKTYTVSFDSNFLSNALNDSAYFGIFGGENASSWTEVLYGSAQVGYAFESVKTNGARSEYTFTLKEKNFDKYYVGFYLAEADTPIEFYLANLTVYETADATKTNILPNTGNDMTKWYNNAGAGTATELGETKAVKYDRYNATQMVKADAKQKTMLYIHRDQNTAAELKLKIDKNILKANTDYVFSFKYKNLNSNEDEMAGYFVLFADDGTTRPGKKYLYSNGGSGTPLKEAFTDGVNGYFVVNLSDEELDVYTNFYAGWSYGGGTDMYIADYVMYELNDQTKKNLLCKDEYSTDMSSWYNYSRASLASELYNFFGASYIPYDDALFKREIAVSGSYNAGDRIVHKLDKSKLSAGREFTMNLDYYLGGLTLDKDVSMVIFGDSDSTDNVYADTVLFGANGKAYSKIINGKSNREYFFEFTKEMLSKYDDLYVGFYFNNKADNVDIHFAHLVVNEVGSSDYAFKQDNYDARVTGWCTSTEKLSVTKLSRDIKTQFFNGRQYPKYVFSELDDGEWWTEEAVKPIEIKGDAVLKGTIFGVDGKPLKNAKLRLVSDAQSFEVTTNAKGEFIFNKIPEGFYQLYQVNAKGELIALDYGITLERGSIVTIKIGMADIYDTTDDGGYSDGADAEDVGSIRGNVYTAQLKVVKGLKMYLRGIGETVTDENGYFEFVDVPVGTYELYTVLANGKEYVFRTVEIKKNIDIQTKLKYDPDTSKDTLADSEDSNILWIIIIAVAGLLIIGTGATVTVLLIKTKKKQK